MAELLRVGLVALEIVERGLDHLPRLLVGADDMDGMADRLHSLLEYEDLVFLGEVANEHEYLLAWHSRFPLMKLGGGEAAMMTGATPLG